MKGRFVRHAAVVGSVLLSISQIAYERMRNEIHPFADQFGAFCYQAQFHLKLRYYY
jgi:hypothetical protein